YWPRSSPAAACPPRRSSSIPRRSAMSALKASMPVLARPGNRRRTVTLTYEQFRYGFANAVDEEQARRLYQEFYVPAAGKPSFQAAFANLNPWTEVRADNRRPDRGPMLVVCGEQDHSPWPIADATYKRQRQNGAVTQIVGIPGCGHSLTVDDGWPDVARHHDRPVALGPAAGRAITAADRRGPRTPPARRSPGQSRTPRGARRVVQVEGRSLGADAWDRGEVVSRRRAGCRPFEATAVAPRVVDLDLGATLRRAPDVEDERQYREAE